MRLQSWHKVTKTWWFWYLRPTRSSVSNRASSESTKLSKSNSSREMHRWGNSSWEVNGERLNWLTSLVMRIFARTVISKFKMSEKRERIKLDCLVVKLVQLWSITITKMMVLRWSLFSRITVLCQTKGWWRRWATNLPWSRQTTIFWSGQAHALKGS